MNNVRRIVCFLLAIVFGFFLLPATVNAADTNVVIEQINYDDGSYALITVDTLLSKSSNSGSKTYTYYNASNVKCFSYTLNGDFTYNGSTSHADSAYANINIFVSGWDVESHSEYTSGNTAYGEAVFTGPNGEERNVNLRITCSATGKIS